MNKTQNHSTFAGVLGALHLLPLIGAGRVVDMQWFHFGEKQIVTDRRGQNREVGTYALHIQCAWRLTWKGSVYVGSSDRYFPKGDPFQEIEDFDWTLPGNNRCDERVQALFQKILNNNLIVESVISDEIGDLRIIFEQESELRLFPDSSIDGEYWRVFRPYHSDKHLVRSRAGFSFE